MNKCKYCDQSCCKDFNVIIDPFDIAKLSYSLDLEFIGDEYGVIKYAGGDLITIKEFDGFPNAKLKYGLDVCPLLDNNGLCTIHEKMIEKKSSLGQLLKKIGLPLNVKPMACRYHPVFYDYEYGLLKKYDSCKLLFDEWVSLVKQDRNMLNESRIIHKLLEKIYDDWEKTGKYQMIKVANSLVNGDISVLF